MRKTIEIAETAKRQATLDNLSLVISEKQFKVTSKRKQDMKLGDTLF